MATQFTEPEQDVTARLREHGQDHVLRWVNELSDEDRAALMAQLADVNLGEVRGFTRMINTPPTDFTFADIRPARVERLPLREPHMQAAGQFKGFTGPDMFAKAVNALKSMCDASDIQYG